MRLGCYNAAVAGQQPRQCVPGRGETSTARQASARQRTPVLGGTPTTSTSGATRSTEYDDLLGETSTTSGATLNFPTHPPSRRLSRTKR